MFLDLYQKYQKVNILIYWIFALMAWLEEEAEEGSDNDLSTT
jgi:hypothetical protein